MPKYILAPIVTLALLSSSVAMAQNAGNTGSSEQMKGPPNANGMSNSGSDMKSGDSGSNSNGAASAKATGEDKK